MALCIMHSGCQPFVYKVNLTSRCNQRFLHPYSVYYDINYKVIIATSETFNI